MPSWKKVITSGSDACLNSITVDSTTVVTNLNADKVDGCDASAFYLATNPSGFTTCTGTVDGTGAANHIAYWTDSDTISYDNGQLYWDASNNRLGIGTNTPTDTLDVRGNSSIGNSVSCLHTFTGDIVQNISAVPTLLGAGRAVNFDGAGSNLYFITSQNGNTGGWLNTLVGATSAYQVYKSTGCYIFATSTAVGGTGLSTKAAFDGSGNFGIGSSALPPSALLDVGGTLKASGNVTFDSNLTVDTNTLHVDSSGNYVGIGTNSPTEKLTVNGRLLVTGSTPVLRFNHPETQIYGTTSGGAGVNMFYEAAGSHLFTGSIILRSNNNLTLRNIGEGDYAQIRNDGTGTDNILAFRTTTTERMRITESELVVNESSQDYDFRVESNNNVNMLFVDGGNDRVGIGTSSPSQTLTVAGNISGSGLIYAPNIGAGVDNSVVILDSDGTLRTDEIDSRVWGSTLVDSTGTPTAGHIPYFTDSNTITMDSGQLYWDASNNRLGIGTNSPSRQFHVYNNTTNAFGLFERAVSGSEGWLAFWGGSGAGNIYTLAGDRLQLGVADTIGGTNFVSKLTIDGNGHVVLNEGSIDQDFRVESNNNANMLFVNGGTDQVGIGTNSTSETLTVKGNTEVSGSIISPNFSAGLLGGDGYRLALSDTVGCTALEVDNLRVRGRLTVVEFLAQQIRATNGTLFVTSTGKVETVTTSGLGPYTACITTPTGSNHGFAVNDRIRAQRFDGFGNVYQSDLTVTAVPNPFAFTASYEEGESQPQPGFEYVRLGNSSDTDRQGGIILSSDLDDSPYIKIYDEVDEHNDIFTAANTKVLVGNLSSHNSTTFGCLSGSGGSPNYGFYASGSAYLEGSINATGGEIGGITICNTSISASNGGFEIKSDGSATFASGQITFESDGDITSNEYLVERSRVFGDGSDGNYTVNTGFTNVAGLFNVSSGTGFRTACLLRDAYFCNLTVTGTSGCSVFIKSNGYRMFVKDTLTICSYGFIENNGNDGANGQNASFEFQGSEGNGGAGTNTGTLLRGTSGGSGGEGGGDA